MSEQGQIIQQIATLMRPWEGPLLAFSGSVPEDEVAWAERELGVTFPASYRAFLRHCGSGRLHHYRLLGIRGGSLWDNVVAVNVLAIPRQPQHLVRVAETLDEHTFHLDTALTGANGECPVRVIGACASGRIFAASFLDFLQRVCAGLGQQWAR